MTITPPASGNRNRLLLMLSALLLVAVVAVAGYYLWGPRRMNIPPIAMEGLDAEVAAAINKARADVESQPRSAAAWGRLGMVLFAQDMYADCLAILAKAERLDGKDPRWPYFRGLALIHRKPEEGIVALERAAAILPDDLTVQLRLAEAYLKLGRIDEADALFQTLLAAHPDNPRVLLGRGQILARRGRYQDALEPLKKAAEHPTARRSARVTLAEAYLRLGNTAEAEAERKRAADASADVPWTDSFLLEANVFRTGLQPRIDQVLALLREGSVEDASELIAAVLADHPNSDEAHLTRAKVQIRTGDAEGAQKTLRRSLELNPDLVDGHFLLAGTLMLQEDCKSAERHYRRAIELKPTYAVAHYNLGDCLLKQDNKSEAAIAFRAALRSRPDLAPAHLALGALLLEDGKVEEAITHLETAVRLEDTNERARALLAQARKKK